jgi:hypothetical protein
MAGSCRCSSTATTLGTGTGTPACRRRCSSTATTLGTGTGTPAVSVAQVEVVLAWTGIHSGARGSCTATVANTDMGTDQGISSCMRVALV